jgi:hypothetical protein
LESITIQGSCTFFLTKTKDLSKTFKVGFYNFQRLFFTKTASHPQGFRRKLLRSTKFVMVVVTVMVDLVDDVAQTNLQRCEPNLPAWCTLSNMKLPAAETDYVDRGFPDPAK